MVVLARAASKYFEAGHREREVTTVSPRVKGKLDAEYSMEVAAIEISDAVMP